MDQRERLIGWIMDSVGGCARNWAEVIADGILERGGLAPPCKVGDTVYRLNIDCTMPYDYDCDDNCYSCKHMVSSVCEFQVRSCSDQVAVMNSYGKFYFLTLEAAQQALKEREAKCK